MDAEYSSLRFSDAGGRSYHYLTLISDGDMECMESYFHVSICLHSLVLKDKGLPLTYIITVHDVLMNT